MCEAKFTKGPWFVDHGFCIIISSDVTGEPMICDLMPAELNDNEMANAHLIAVAPEMYEILSEINYQLGSVYGDRINDLLAKARGEHV
ncbi:hypothetical protein VPHF89G1_0055 [Vibrio phage F89 g1]